MRFLYALEQIQRLQFTGMAVTEAVDSVQSEMGYKDGRRLWEGLNTYKAELLELEANWQTPCELTDGIHLHHLVFLDDDTGLIRIEGSFDKHDFYP